MLYEVGCAGIIVMYLIYLSAFRNEYKRFGGGFLQLSSSFAPDTAPCKSHFQSLERETRLPIALQPNLLVTDSM